MLKLVIVSENHKVEEMERGTGTVDEAEGPCLKREGSIWIFVQGHRVPCYATADRVVVPTQPGLV